MKLPFASAITLAQLSLSACAGVFAESQFTTNADGWRIADYENVYQTYGGAPVFHPVTYNATGGNTDGHISSFDPGAGAFTFDAPAKFLGNLTTAVNGQLLFSINCDKDDYTDDNVVIFIGSISGVSRVIVSVIQPQPAPTWTSYSIPLIAANFRYDNKNGVAVTPADFASIMATVSAIRISGEFSGAVQETTRLDAVQLLAPSNGQAPEISIAMYPGITIQGVIGATYRIDYTNDLSNPNWMALSTITLSTTSYLYTDSTATNQPRRFYRAVAL